MKRPAPSLLPRSQTLVSWKRMADPSLESIAAMAGEIFPWPLRQLDWGYACSKAAKNGTTVLFAARMRTQTEPPVPCGVCPRFVADWKWFVHNRPDFAESGTGVLINKSAPETELTVIHEGFPVYCRALPDGPLPPNIPNEIAKILAHLQRNQRLIIQNDVATHTVPPTIEASSLLEREEDVPWIIKPQTSGGFIPETWRRHKNAALAILSIFLIAGSAALHGLEQRDQLRLKKIRRELIAPRDTPPDRALASLLMTASLAPAKTHLLNFHYDAAEKSFSFDGRASDYGTVSSYMSALTGHKDVGRVQGDKAQLILVGGQPVVEFSARGSLR